MAKLIELDLAEIEHLAGCGLSEREICDALGISEDTLGRRKKIAEFADAIKRGKAKARETVANKLFELCKGGNVVACIWWEKTRYGMSDRLQVSGVPTKPVLVSEGFTSIAHDDDGELVH